MTNYTLAEAPLTVGETVEMPLDKLGGLPRGRGLFLNFEGMDGSGKSTQLQRLAARLRSSGFEVLETAEPGGTPIGVQIRRILLDARNHALCPTAELLLYFASRAQNVEEFILPALERGAVVLTDRFTDSTMAYQGFARELGEEVVEALDRVACRGLKPNLTLLFDIEWETSLARAQARNQKRAAQKTPDGGETRMEDQALVFYEKVHQAYRTMAAREPERFAVIDGAQTIEQVEAAVWAAVAPLLVESRR